MQQHTHKQPFVHLAYRKNMIDDLPLRELCQRVKAAAIVLGAPFKVLYSGTARDRQGTLLDLTHGWYEIKVERYPRQRYFPLLGPEETREICPEQDVWEHLLLFQPASEEEEEQA